MPFILGIRIFPGEMNKGIFVRLTENAKEEAIGEEYQITHPTASINGLLRGSLWVSIGSTTSITCRGGRRKDDSPSRLRTLVEYKDEASGPSLCHDFFLIPVPDRVGWAKPSMR